MILFLSPVLFLSTMLFRSAKLFMSVALFLDTKLIFRMVPHLFTLILLRIVLFIVILILRENSRICERINTAFGGMVTKIVFQI